MAQSLDDFDFHRVDLDSNETYARDFLKLDIESWAKFRHVVAIGNDSPNLKSTTGNPVPEEVKDSYRDFGKSHYQVVVNLTSGYACIQTAKQVEFAINTHGQFNLFQRSLVEAYFHFGCALDGIARLIYILSDQDSTSAYNERWKAPQRKCIGSGQLGSKQWYCLKNLVEQYRVLEIRDIRNAVTHTWPVTSQRFVMRDNREKIFWPEEIRKLKYIAWPYDEPESKEYTYKVPAVDMALEHFHNLEAFLSEVFESLTDRVPDWERNNNVEIVG